MSDVCGTCQSTNLEEAALTGAGLHPVRASTLRKALAAAEIKARVCLDCGAIDRLRADTKTLRKILGDKAK